MKTKFRTEVIYSSTDEKLMRNVATWLSKVTKLARFTVRKRRLLAGDEWQLKIKYKPSIRAATLVRIGYNLSTYTENRIMMIERRKPLEETVTVNELSERFSISDENDLPFGNE